MHTQQKRTGSLCCMHCMNTQEKLFSSLYCMHCYAQSGKTCWLSVMNTLLCIFKKKYAGSLCCIHCYVYSRKRKKEKKKKCCFTVLCTLLCIVKKNVLAHCAVCIVMEAEADKESSIQILIQIGFRDGDDQNKLRPGHSIWIRPLGPSTQ